MGLRWRGRGMARTVLAAVAGATVIAASVAACGPNTAGTADPPGSSASASTAVDTSLDSLPFGSVGGGFDPLPGGPVASVPVGAGATVTVPVAGHGGVPATGASAVALAVSVAGGAAAGSVTVYAAGGSQPGVPSVSWPAGADASGLAVSALSSGGAVAVDNSSGQQVTVTLAADGYWLAGTPVAAGTFGPLAGGQVARVLLGGGQTVSVPVAGHGGVPGSGAGTVALAVTAVGAFGAGRVNVYPAGTRPPAVSGLSWAGGAAASGLVVSALSSGGTVAVRNSSVFPVTVTLAADGYWLSGTPAAAGTFGSLAGGHVARMLLAAGKTVTVPTAGHAGVPASDAAAVALTVSTAGPGAGSVTVYPADASPPGVPSLSWPAQRTASSLVVSALSAGGAVAVHNSSAQPVLVTLGAAGYWLSAGRTVSDITAKPTTMTLTGSDVTAVSGVPGATQTVTLAAAAPVPAVGRVLVAPTSAGAPDGLLGTVTAITGGSGGAHVVTLSPASLDEAYSTFNVSTSQTVTDSDVVQTPVTQAGQTQSTSATPISLMSHIEPAAPSAGSSGSGYDLTKTQFDCQGSGAGPTIAVTADLSDTSVDLSLDANPAAPNIHFLITSDPVFDLNLGFTGQVTCKLAGQRLLEIKIPVAATPPLAVDLYPVVTLTAGGQASLQFEWKPRAELGFDKGPGIDSETHGFGSSSKVGISATAGADLFLGLDAEITLAGAIGVGGDIGPDLSVLYDASHVCVTVDGELKADLTADAHVFVKDWAFALATGVFGKLQLYTNCNGASASAQPLAMSANLPTGAVGQPYNGAVTATGGDPPYTFSRSSGSLPDGLSLSSAGAVTGTPQSSGSAVFTVKVTDSAGASTSQTFSFTINGSGGSGGSGTGWTAITAALPANNQGISDVSGVSCPSTSQCVAIGEYATNLGPDVPLLLTGTGQSWTAVEGPPLAGQTDGLWPLGARVVSCPSTSDCVAITNYDVINSDNTVSDGLAALTLSGGSWTATDVPLPANADPHASLLQPAAISCPSVSQCTAVGTYWDTSNHPHGVLLTLSNGSWTAAEPPVPANGVPPSSAPDQAGVNLYGVSCPSVSQCVATGQYTNTDGNAQAMVLTWSGGSWTAAETPVPSDASSNVGALLSRVSCPSVSHCMAVGEYVGTASQQGMILTWSGGSWTAAGLPLPANADTSAGNQAFMTGISCPSDSQCAATGYYNYNGQGQDPMVLTLANGSWTATEASLPADAGSNPDASLNGVSCASASQCVATGYYTNSSGKVAGLLLAGPG